MTGNVSVALRLQVVEQIVYRRPGYEHDSCTLEHEGGVGVVERGERGQYGTNDVFHRVAVDARRQLYLDQEVWVLVEASYSLT